MMNMLHVGYQITRADETKDKYYGWTIDEIRSLEVLRFGNHVPFEAVRLYSIQGNLSTYYLLTTTDKGERKLIVRNEGLDEWTELERDDVVAGYIWNMIYEDAEENGAAYKAMAIDIFGTFEHFRSYAFMHCIKQFNKEAHYVEMVEHSIAKMW